MKLNAGKRILMFLHWLCSLLIAAALVLVVLKPPFAVDLFEKGKAMVTESQLKIIGIGVLAVYAIIAIAELCLIFKRRKKVERGFVVMDSSDSGRVRIAIPAIEQMVRRSVTDIEGITDMKIKIESDDDAINIDVNASLINGGHVPTVTMNMQQAIRQFVEMNCGVAVRSVHIVIRSVTEPSGRKRKNKKNAALAAPSEPVAEKEPIVVPAEPEAAEPAEAPAEPETVEPADAPIEPEPVEPTEPEAEPIAVSVEPVEPEMEAPAYEDEPEAQEDEAEDEAYEAQPAVEYFPPEEDEDGEATLPAEDEAEAEPDYASDFEAEPDEPAEDDDAPYAEAAPEDEAEPAEEEARETQPFDAYAAEPVEDDVPAEADEVEDYLSTDED